jgi:hypothetical protein
MIPKSSEATPGDSKVKVNNFGGDGIGNSDKKKRSYELWTNPERLPRWGCLNLQIKNIEKDNIER